MITSKSPRKVLKLAHQLAGQVLPPQFSRFSRKDFTQPQLFACLVLREHQKKSFRGIEALLADSSQWLADIGLHKPPDHNTAEGKPSAAVSRGRPVHEDGVGQVDARSDGQAVTRSQTAAPQPDQAVDDGFHVVREPPRRPSLRAPQA